MLDNYNVGFIGGGAMAEAIISGAISSGVLSPSNVFVSDLKKDRVAFMKERYKVNASTDAKSFLSKVDMLIIAVKPQVAYDAMVDVSSLISPKTVVASIVAGFALGKIEKIFSDNPVIRVMPNTPLAVGAGMSAYSLGNRAEASLAQPLVEILSACGKVVEVGEKEMDAVTGLSGSAPAFVFLLIDALSDGGVAAGLSRKTAVTLAAQTMLGAAKMVLDTGRHPCDLRDQVTSPAGTTIAGIRAMEKSGVRGAMIDAVLAAAERSKELGK